jgi:hypothetical protein
VSCLSISKQKYLSKLPGAVLRAIDQVMIRSSPPISARKRFILDQIIRFFAVRRHTKTPRPAFRTLIVPLKVFGYSSRPMCVHSSRSVVRLVGHQHLPALPPYQTGIFVSEKPHGFRRKNKRGIFHRGNSHRGLDLLTEHVYTHREGKRAGPRPLSGTRGRHE